jgi:hypothetical protein
MYMTMLRSSQVLNPWLTLSSKPHLSLPRPFSDDSTVKKVAPEARQVRIGKPIDSPRAQMLPERLIYCIDKQENPAGRLNIENVGNITLDSPGETTLCRIEIGREESKRIRPLNMAFTYG